jgi:opacity protein-like surface antigen
MSLALLLAAAPLSAAPLEGTRIGLVFCASAFPVAAMAYEGGFGAQIETSKLLGRAGARFAFDDRGPDPSELGWGLSLAGGYRLAGGPASLYAGAFAEFSHSESKTTVDADDWTTSVASELGFGPLVGVELALLPNLSVFLDYELAFDFSFPSEIVSAGGTVTRNDEEVERLFATRLGNSALIGICVYFR